MTDQPKFPSGTRVQLTLRGEVLRPVLVGDHWVYPVRIDGGPTSKVVTCGEQAIEAEGLVFCEDCGQQIGAPDAKCLGPVGATSCPKKKP